ncbi:Winged helix DNA-binding domain [Geoglobus ahangari]|uniref:Winged helix DNA-binding domain n=1 Tax=Geoglobus ahangari TaxID=113653 RepID=A0A0F7IHP8_9EURY|nr:MarR family transcriptional regulator [Geoglobus ahangari]AKG92479.1 Winged helix DNA-binding domain [Geoglobus ahangari]
MDVLKQLFLLNKNLRRIVERRLEGRLTFLEFKFLRLIFSGRKSQKELVELTGMTKGTVSKVLSSLEERGLIVRVRKGKGFEVEVTESGRRLMEEFDTLTDEIQRILLRGFSEEEVRVIEDLFRRMVRNLEEEDGSEN